MAAYPNGMRMGAYYITPTHPNPAATNSDGPIARHPNVLGTGSDRHDFNLGRGGRLGDHDRVGLRGWRRRSIRLGRDGGGIGIGRRCGGSLIGRLRLVGIGWSWLVNGLGLISRDILDPSLDTARGQGRTHHRKT